MTHADRLRLRILAALLFTETSTGCDSAQPQPPTGVEPRPAGQPPQPEPGPVAAPLVEPDPVVPGSLVEPDPVVPGPAPTPGPIAGATLDPGLPEPHEPGSETRLDAADPQPRATCPSGTWCGVLEPGHAELTTPLGCPARATDALKPIAPDNHGPGWPTTTLDAALTRSTRASGTDDACCYRWVEPCPGGRPLVDGAAVITAELRPSTTTTTTSTSPRAPHPTAAEAWLQDAGDEYASVASFSRAAIELMAVGAPADLVADCHHAALDELRHARLCTEIAWSLGAARRAPTRVAAVAPREATLARLAADTFVEGCVGETIAALALRRAASGCEDLPLRRALDEIAEDEERHAALAWRTVRWALAQGRAEVVDALRAAAARIRPALRVTTASEPDSALARCGRLDPAAQAEVVRCGWRDVVDPLLAKLLV